MTTKTLNIRNVLFIALNFPLAMIGLSPVRKDETLSENAQRFVKVIVKEARENRYVHAWRAPKSSGTDKHMYGWNAMVNEHWRRIVKELLAEEAVSRVNFIEPDSQGDWSFDCISTFPVPHVATLLPDDKLHS